MYGACKGFVCVDIAVTKAVLATSFHPLTCLPREKSLHILTRLPWGRGMSMCSDRDGSGSNN